MTTQAIEYLTDAELADLEAAVSRARAINLGELYDNLGISGMESLLAEVRAARKATSVGDVAQAGETIRKALEEAGRSEEDCCDRCHYRALDTDAVAALSLLLAQATRAPKLEADLAQRTRERDSEMEERWKVSENRRQLEARAEAAETESTTTRKLLAARDERVEALEMRVATLTSELETERDRTRREAIKATNAETARNAAIAESRDLTVLLDGLRAVFACTDDSQLADAAVRLLGEVRSLRKRAAEPERAHASPGAEAAADVTSEVETLKEQLAEAHAAHGHEVAGLRHEIDCLREELRIPPPPPTVWADLLSAVGRLPKPSGHSGDEEAGEHDEDCEMCGWEAIQEMAKAARRIAPPTESSASVAKQPTKGDD